MIKKKSQDKHEEGNRGDEQRQLCYGSKACR